MTYAGQEVASVEFLGCLDVDYPGTSVLQILDDTGLDGEFSYTITPALADPNNPNSDVLCEAADLVANPPATQNSANALALSGVSNLHQHYLSYDCAWDVTFTGKPACQDSVVVWRDAPDGLVFADAVTDTHELGALRVRLVPRNRSLLVSDPSAKHPDRNTNQNVSEELIPGLGYYIGSGGGQQLAADALSGGGSSGTGGGSAGLPGGPAADEIDFVASPALSLECASEIEVASRSGLEGPGLELAVTSPGVAATTTAASACTTNQDRLPGFDRLEAAESFSLVLNRRCSWNITFKSRAETCSAAVRILDTATPPALLDTLWTIPGQSATIALAANAAGLQYTPASGSSGGTATAVGALELYNCFYPSVSLAATDISADTQFTVSFAVIGTQPGCTTAASQVVLTNDPSATNAQRTQSSIEGRGFKFRIQGERALLNSLAGDGSLCEYDVRVTGPAEVGQLVSLGDALTARTSYVALERPRPAVVLQNLTSAVASGLPAARQSVVVAVAPRASCPQGAPNASPYTLAPASFEGDRATLQLGAAACVWDISYRTANSDCLVAAQFKDRTGNDIGEANASGSLVVTSRVGTSQPTQLGSIEFTVLSCFSTFEASLSVSVTDLQAGANHAGEVVTATIAPTQSAPVGCSPSQTLRLTLDASNRASVRTTLAKVPEGTGTSCSYQVSFADSLVTAGGVLLARTSAATAELNAPPALASPAAIAATTRITASYTASRPATVRLTNATLFGSNHSPDTRREVLVTTTPTASQTCTEPTPTSSPYTIHAASSIPVALGTQVCAWTISYANPADDCVVSAQLKEPDGTDIGTPDTDGELTIYVDASNQAVSAASSGTRIGSIEFTVTSDCTTFFDASLSITAASFTQDARPDLYAVTVAPTSTSPTGCTASQNVWVVLSAADAGKTSASTTATVNLIATPVTQAACSYTVTFPEYDFSTARSTQTADSVYQRAATSAATATISPDDPSTSEVDEAAASASYVLAANLEQVILVGTREGYSVDLGNTWDLTSSNCVASDGMALTIPAQDQTQAVPQPHIPGQAQPRMAQYLDYRCNWQMAFGYTGVCQSSRTASLEPSSQLPLSAVTTANLMKDVANTRFRMDNFGLKELLLIAIGRTIGGAVGDCLSDSALIIAAKDGTSALTSLEGKDVSYKLQPDAPAIEQETVNCGANPTERPASPTSGMLYKHILDYRCDWRVEFAAPPVANKCLVVEAGYAATEDATPVIHATKGTIFTLHADYNQDGVGEFDSSESQYTRFTVAGAPADQPINRLLVSYEDQTGANDQSRCATTLQVTNFFPFFDGRFNRNPSESALNFSLTPEKTRQSAANPRGQACTPNAASYTQAEIDAQTPNGVLPQYGRRFFGLGHNCDWVLTFSTVIPDCAITAKFYDGDTQVTTVRRKDPTKLASDSGNSATVPYTVQVDPNQTGTIRLWAEDGRLKTTVRREAPTTEGGEPTVISHAVSWIEFETCALLDGQTSIRMVDRTPSDVEVSYEFVPVRCVGAGLPPSQDASDMVPASRLIYEDDPDSTTDKLIIQTADFQHLSYFCDWQVSFDAPGNCVVVKAHFLEHGSHGFRTSDKSDTATGTFTLHTQYTHLPRHSTNPWLFYNNVRSKPVHELEYSVTDPDECSQLVGQRIPLRNISDLAGIGAVNLNFALTDDTCMPNTGEAPSEFVLGPQETRDIYLARNCDWTITHSSASAEFCTSWLSAYDTTGFLSNEFSSLNLVKDDSDLTQDLKESTLEFVPGEFRVNGCRNRYSQNPGFNGAKVVVLDRTRSGQCVLRLHKGWRLRKWRDCA